MPRRHRLASISHDRPARQAGAVPSRAHPPVDLGRDHDLLAAGEILQRTAEDLLAYRAGNRADRGTWSLTRGDRSGTAAADGAGTRFRKSCAHRLKNGEQGYTAQRRVIGCTHLADLDLADAFEALRHDFHVRLHDGVALLAELLYVLLVDDFAILLQEPQFCGLQLLAAAVRELGR